MDIQKNLMYTWMTAETKDTLLQLLLQYKVTKKKYTLTYLNQILNPVGINVVVHKVLDNTAKTKADLHYPCNTCTFRDSCHDNGKYYELIEIFYAVNCMQIRNILRSLCKDYTIWSVDFNDICNSKLEEIK